MQVYEVKINKDIWESMLKNAQLSSMCYPIAIGQDEFEQYYRVKVRFEEELDLQEFIHQMYHLGQVTPPAFANLNSECLGVHEKQVEKGFWDEERNVGEMLMLIVSELAEGLEAHRKSRHANISNYHMALAKDQNFIDAFKAHIKDTFEDELADAYIRILDLCGGLNINLQWHVQQKLQFNESRPHKHGKNY